MRYRLGMDERDLEDDDLPDWPSCSVPGCDGPMSNPPFRNGAGQPLCQSHALVGARGRCVKCSSELLRSSVFVDHVKAYPEEDTGRVLCIDCWASQPHPKGCHCGICMPHLDRIIAVIAEYRARVSLAKKPATKRRTLARVIQQERAKVQPEVWRLYR